MFLGYRGAYGAAGLGLGPRYGHVGMKGPVQGMMSLSAEKK